MFDQNFTFDPLRSPSLDSSNASSTHDSSRSVSPCSPTGPLPPPARCSVNDLASQFDRQRLRQDAQICYQPCDSYANLDDDAGWAIPAADSSLDDLDMSPPTRVRTAPARSYSPSRRLQRQAQTRMLCSGTHHKDIAVLLEGMIDSSEQCSITKRPSFRDEDEGYDSAEAGDRVGSRRSSAVLSRRPTDYRRASDLNRTGASISKSIRFRSKEKSLRSQRSSDKPLHGAR